MNHDTSVRWSHCRASPGRACQKDGAEFKRSSPDSTSDPWVPSCCTALICQVFLALVSIAKPFFIMLSERHELGWYHYHDRGEGDDLADT